MFTVTGVTVGAVGDEDSPPPQPDVAIAARAVA
jgi:hypothetical protein